MTEIVVRHPLLKKAVAWLEQRPKPVRAFIFTASLFVAVGLAFLVGATILSFFGWLPVALTVLFFLVWAQILKEMN